MRMVVELSALPKWRLVRWLTHTESGVPEEIRALLVLGLFASWPSLVLGGLANLLVNVAALVRHPMPAFAVLLVADLALLICRIVLVIVGRRAIARGSRPPTDLYILSGVLWAALVGLGTAMCMTSRDPILQALAPTTMMGVVSGIATRNHVFSRLAIVQVVLCDLPANAVLPFLECAWFLISTVQCPLFLLSIGSTVGRLSRGHVAVMVAQRESERRATHDALTGLLNRSGLMDALARALQTVPTRNEPLALMYLDLDDFKNVNDTFGHAAGDMLLRHVGERLRAVLPDECLAARIGGDEFVVLAPRHSLAQASHISKALITDIATPFDVGPGVKLTTSVSIGLASASPGTTPEQLLAEADAGLYRAKLEGKGRCSVANEQTPELADGPLAA